MSTNSTMKKKRLVQERNARLAGERCEAAQELQDDPSILTSHYHFNDPHQMKSSYGAISSSSSSTAAEKKVEPSGDYHHHNHHSSTPPHDWVDGEYNDGVELPPGFHQFMDRCDKRAEKERQRQEAKTAPGTSSISEPFYMEGQM